LEKISLIPDEKDGICVKNLALITKLGHSKSELRSKKVT